MEESSSQDLGMESAETVLMLSSVGCPLLTTICVDLVGIPQGPSVVGQVLSTSYVEKDVAQAFRVKIMVAVEKMLGNTIAFLRTYLSLLESCVKRFRQFGGGITENESGYFLEPIKVTEVAPVRREMVAIWI